MPPRRLTALPLALIATVSLTGCAIELSPESVPLPFSVAPTPAGSAGVPAYVCTAAYKILTDGAVQLATKMSSSSDSAKQDMRDAFTDMATKLGKEAAGTTDQALKQALSTVAADLTAAAQQPDPKAYVNGDFQTVGQKLDNACADT
ncbi:hypothetical protein GCM10010172_56630 [Paractinoplanes ferrugineus]|uniref:Uncharacterized protein n=1 Tax=Paractinoplanes ferrugineus TaxID=113564 RepID=A0A919IZX1_9ACTN|nr:hypothetical protein [Actinoplanes ferrugineus]GIE10867.1 hypothetical protein Afe05nite_27070 [Actinoplanes ferrugineus]